MAMEYQLSYTANEINKKLGQVGTEASIPESIARTAWVTENFASKEDVGNVDLSALETKTDAANKLKEAKNYADTAATKVKNDLLNGAGTAYDTLQELGTLIDENTDAIDALETVAGNKANASDLTSHTGNKSNPHGVTLSQLGVTADATELNYVDGVTSNVQTQLNKKADDFSLEIYNGTSGNPKPVKFMTVNYSTCGSENGVAIKLGMVSGHGNGSSYACLQDAIIKVTHTGVVTVDNFKYYGADTGTYDGASRQYGDIFWTIDTTNKIVDFYCLMGQYARIQMTPYKRVTYSTGGTITQHTSCTVYSSGDKVWANNSNFALKSDVPSRTETWTFTLEDGSTVNKVVYVG